MMARRITIAVIVAIIALAWSAPTARAQPSKSMTGLAAYYDIGYRGKTTSGEPYDPDKLTAAHRTLPLGTRLRVTDVKTGHSVVVTVNDRGPFNKGLIIDLSLAAAQALDMINRGIIKVRVDIQ
jgi:rare lipoprotein A